MFVRVGKRLFRPVGLRESDLALKDIGFDTMLAAIQNARTAIAEQDPDGP
jgi:hypothetical protein